ncbi:protein of unknown function [Xenorhabdus doucetiae]|uniref:Uncharacterized protein n=1 Tax=Xenorhabdus doucetiae TaxID=351671 RepID=A0A068QTC0_9GAMM|nr:protein of unknown function [Xenorhabdus doucetiae]
MVVKDTSIINFIDFKIFSMLMLKMYKPIEPPRCLKIKQGNLSELSKIPQQNSFPVFC